MKRDYRLALKVPGGLTFDEFSRNNPIATKEREAKAKMTNLE